MTGAFGDEPCRNFAGIQIISDDQSFISSVDITLPTAQRDSFDSEPEQPVGVQPAIGNFWKGFPAHNANGITCCRD